MVAGIDRYILRMTKDSVTQRKLWHARFVLLAGLRRSVAANRDHLRRIVGAVNPAPAFGSPDYLAGPGRGSLVGQGAGFEIHRVRWPALSIAGPDNAGAGNRRWRGAVAVAHSRPPIADCVALPDADQTPEMLMSLAPGVDSRIAIRPPISGERLSRADSDVDQSRRQLFAGRRATAIGSAPSRIHLSRRRIDGWRR